MITVVVEAGPGAAVVVLMLESPVLVERVTDGRSDGAVENLGAVVVVSMIPVESVLSAVVTPSPQPPVASAIRRANALLSLTNRENPFALSCMPPLASNVPCVNCSTTYDIRNGLIGLQMRQGAWNVHER